MDVNFIDLFCQHLWRENRREGGGGTLKNLDISVITECQKEGPDRTNKDTAIKERSHSFKSRQLKSYATFHFLFAILTPFNLKVIKFF